MDKGDNQVSKRRKVRVRATPRSDADLRAIARVVIELALQQQPDKTDPAVTERPA